MAYLFPLSWSQQSIYSNALSEQTMALESTFQINSLFPWNRELLYTLKSLNMKIIFCNETFLSSRFSYLSSACSFSLSRPLIRSSICRRLPWSCTSGFWESKEARRSLPVSATSCPLSRSSSRVRFFSWDNSWRDRVRLLLWTFLLFF